MASSSTISPVSTVGSSWAASSTSPGLTKNALKCSTWPRYRASPPPMNWRKVSGISGPAASATIPRRRPLICSGCCSIAASSCSITENLVSDASQKRAERFCEASLNVTVTRRNSMSRFSDLPRLSRREWMRLASAGVVAYSTSGWIERLAAETSANPERKKSCILLWMNGGPSQMDTFDLKPGHANGGPFKEIQTSATGLKISEHLPKIAKFGDKMVPIRSMNTTEADHGRATFYMRTGSLPQGAIQYPTMG